MISLISLLPAAALVLLQCSYTNAQLDNNKLELDNSLQPNAPVPRARLPRTYVNIPRPPPAAARLTPGEELELSCSAYGKPAPSIRWLKNGRPLESEIESNELIPEEPSSLASGTSILVISEASRPEDVYTCVATSADVQKTVTTTVYSTPAAEGEAVLSLQKLLRLPLRPRVTMYYDTLLQNIGTNVVLPCQVNSAEKSQVYWQDNKDNLVYGNPRMQVLPSGELVISNLRWGDMGQYTCSVKNMLGKDSVSTFIYPLKHKGH